MVVHGQGEHTPSVQREFSSSTTASTGAVRRARAAARVAFAAVGLVSASWAARLPAVQDRLDLSSGELAVAVLGIEGGALLGLPLGAALSTRWRSRSVAAAGFLVYGPGVLVAALAPSLQVLTVGLAVWAAANSLVDVALNAQGVAVEKRSGRPVLSGLHATQGIGLLLGAGVATSAAAIEVGLGTHLAAVSTASLAAGLMACRSLLPTTGTGGSAARGRGRPVLPGRNLLVVGGVAFCAFLVDGTATSWIAVHLRSDHAAGPAWAAAGYLAFTTALVLVRFTGDRLRRRFPRNRIVATCGCLTAAGALGAVLAPTAAVALGGWVAVGLAVALLAPTVLAAAPAAALEDAARRGDTPAPAAIATVTTIGYLGSFSGPPAVGAFAGAVGLSVALGVLVVAGVAAAVLARLLPGPAPSRR